MPPKIILIRHGEAEHKSAHNFKLSDPPLTANGRRQCEELGALLAEHPLAKKVELVITSPLYRTLQTTQLAFGWMWDGRANYRNSSSRNNSNSNDCWPESRRLVVDGGKSLNKTQNTHTSYNSQEEYKNHSANVDADEDEDGDEVDALSETTVASDESRRQSRSSTISFKPAPRKFSSSSSTVAATASPARTIPVIASAMWQETTNLPCDTGRAIRFLSPDFPGIDFAGVRSDPYWPIKIGVYEYTQLALRRRIRECIAWLAQRPEAVIAVVSHSGLLRRMTGRRFANADFRVFEIEQGRFPLVPHMQQKRQDCRYRHPTYPGYRKHRDCEEEERESLKNSGDFDKYCMSKTEVEDYISDEIEDISMRSMQRRNTLGVSAMAGLGIGKFAGIKEVVIAIEDDDEDDDENNNHDNDNDGNNNDIDDDPYAPRVVNRSAMSPTSPSSPLSPSGSATVSSIVMKPVSAATIAESVIKGTADVMTHANGTVVMVQHQSEFGLVEVDPTTGTGGPGDGRGGRGLSPSAPSLPEEHWAKIKMGAVRRVSEVTRDKEGDMMAGFPSLLAQIPPMQRVVSNEASRSSSMLPAVGGAHVGV